MPGLFLLRGTRLNESKLRPVTQSLRSRGVGCLLRLIPRLRQRVCRPAPIIGAHLYLIGCLLLLEVEVVPGVPGEILLLHERLLGHLLIELTAREVHLSPLQINLAVLVLHVLQRHPRC